MKSINVTISEEAYNQLLEIQFERKKKKKEPSALNKIASEVLNDSLVMRKNIKKGD